MLDGLTSGFYFVVLVKTVDGALGAYWAMTSKAKVSQLLILVVFTRIRNLITCSFVNCRGVRLDRS